MRPPIRQYGRMGHGDYHDAENEVRCISTMHLVLVLLRSSLPRPLSTYEIGLAVVDDKEPPRPMSVLIKTLSKDKYVERVSLLGKRAALWTITERGIVSLDRRIEATRTAEKWLFEHHNHGHDEKIVMTSLAMKGPQAASRLAANCGLLHSPVRTALKKLQLRGFVVHTKRPSSEYRLTEAGMTRASKL